MAPVSPWARRASGANVYTKPLVVAALQSVPLKRPKPTARKKQTLCGDKGYDYPDVRQLVREGGQDPDQVARRGGI